MVPGLEQFGKHFADFSDSYVLIGGAAADLAMDEAGLPFRATKDLDIVLHLEVLQASFSGVFWDFVRAGQYEIQERADGRQQYYRFKKPKVPGYPAMLELFTRKPDQLNIPEGSHLTPIPMDSAAKSLSAILLNEAYYEFIHSGRRLVRGLSVIGADRLIPLKAHAWIDLTAKKAGGQDVDSKDISKHRNDVFRLTQLLVPTDTIQVSKTIRMDMQRFIEKAAIDSIDLKAIRAGFTSVHDILATLSTVYQLA